MLATQLPLWAPLAVGAGAVAGALWSWRRHGLRPALTGLFWTGAALAAGALAALALGQVYARWPQLAVHFGRLYGEAAGAGLAAGLWLALPRRRWRAAWLPALAGLTAIGAGYGLAASFHHRLAAGAAVAAGIGLLILAAGLRRRAVPDPKPPDRRLRPYWIPLLAVAALALAFRLYGFGRLPLGISVDEAAKAAAAIDILEGKAVYEPFYRYRESAFAYLVTGSFALFGLSQAALQLPSLLVGLAVLALAFVLLRRFYGTPAAIAGLLCLGLSLWHLQLSRHAERLVLVPLVQLVMLLAADSAGRRGSVPAYAGLGAVLGAGMHTYPPARLLPLLALVALAPCWWSRRRLWRRHLAGSLTAAALFTGVLILPYGGDLPEAVEAVTSSQRLGYREPQWLGGAAALAENAATLTETWYCRPAPRGTTRVFNSGNFPLFQPLLGLAAAAGLAGALARGRRYEYAMPVMVAVIGALPGVFSYALERRLILTTLMLLLLAGVGLADLYRLLVAACADRRDRALPLVAAGAGAALLAAALGQRAINLLYPFRGNEETMPGYLALAAARQQGPVTVVVGYLDHPSYWYYWHREHTGLCGPDHDHWKGLVWEQDASWIPPEALDAPRRIVLIGPRDGVYTANVARLQQYYPENQPLIGCDAQGREACRVYVLSPVEQAAALQSGAATEPAAGPPATAAGKPPPRTGPTAARGP